MRTHWFACALMPAAIAICGWTAPLHAADGGGFGGRRAEIADRVKEKLGLTDEQTQKIKETLATEKDSIKDILHRLQTAQAELRDTIQNTNATEAQVRAAAGKVATVEADSAVLRAKLYKQVAPVLTAEQMDKLKELNVGVDQLLTRVIEAAGSRLRER